MPACSLSESDAVDRSDQRPPEARLLVVRHGPDRGPQIRMRKLRPPYCQPLFDDINRRWPELAKRLEFWETGRPQPPLDGISAVLFLLQDPLAERFPDCFADAVPLADAARSRGITIVNGPESLSNTIKSRQAEIWRQHGFSTPPCLAFTTLDELHALAERMEGAMILKADREHAQAHMTVVEDRASLTRLPADLIPLPGSLSPLVDTRAGYQTLDPDSPYATHYHKKRAMVFGRHVCHNHVFFAESPIVGCVSSSFGHFRSWNPWRRWVGNVRCRRHIECDLEYHFSSCPHATELATAARALGLEFCAIDYAVHADGSIVLWEANPHFSLHRWPVAVLSGPRKLAERIPRMHQAAARFFGDLVGVPL